MWFDVKKSIKKTKNTGNVNFNEFTNLIVLFIRFCTIYMIIAQITIKTIFVERRIYFIVLEPNLLEKPSTKKNVTFFV